MISCEPTYADMTEKSWALSQTAKSVMVSRSSAMTFWSRCVGPGSVAGSATPKGNTSARSKKRATLHLPLQEEGHLHLPLQEEGHLHLRRCRCK